MSTIELDKESLEILWKLLAEAKHAEQHDPDTASAKKYYGKLRNMHTTVDMALDNCAVEEMAPEAPIPVNRSKPLDLCELNDISNALSAHKRVGIAEYDNASMALVEAKRVQKEAIRHLDKLVGLIDRIDNLKQKA